VSGGAAPPTLAGLLDGARWEHDPARRPVSPLLPTARYFQDFPWDGEEPPRRRPAPKLSDTR